MMELTTIEQSELTQYETVIARGLETFYEVGSALLAIRDKRLYKMTGTFEEYCQTRWQMSKTRAFQFMGAVGVIDNLTPVGMHYDNIKSTDVDILPQSEYVARPLSPLPPSVQREVWEEVIKDNPKPTQKQVIAAVNTHMGKFNDGMRSSETPEHYTPDKIIDRVVALFGEIDLDPCSNAGIPNIPALNHYTQTDDGFAHEWPGKVYLNPPYGAVIGDWINRLIHQYDMEITTEAIALLPARTDTDWFEPLFNYPICFVHGRLKFKGNEDNSAPFPSVVVYFGSRIQAFRQHFSDLGTIVKKIK